MKTKEGLIVAVDGRDAVGKSTLSEILVNKLKDSGHPATTVPEFSDTDLGRMITQNAKKQRFYSLSGDGTSPVADTLALAADMLLKARHAKEMKNQGLVAVSDRGLLSFQGYQGVRVDSPKKEPDYQGDSDWVAGIARNISFQDITFWLRISDEEMKRRIALRSEKPLDAEALAFLQQVEEMMENNQDLGTNTIVVDAERDIADLSFWMMKIINHLLLQDLPPLSVSESFLATDDSSLILLKPEIKMLDEPDKRRFNSHLNNLIRGLLVGKLNVALNFNQSQALWKDAISSYPWRYKYYHHMTSAPVEALVLRGSGSATRIKQLLRNAWQGTIGSLSADVPFKMELVHGSDPTAFRTEMDVLNLDVANRIGLNQNKQ